MIVDVHGHYTTEPKDLHRFRKEQTEAANAKDKSRMPPRSALKMSDDEIRQSIEGNQLKMQRERGTDSKAGGRDYLPLFMQAKVTVERF